VIVFEPGEAVQPEVAHDHGVEIEAEKVAEAEGSSKRYARGASAATVTISPWSNAIIVDEMAVIVAAQVDERNAAGNSVKADQQPQTQRS
jgi:hypothetical protein